MKIQRTYFRRFAAVILAVALAICISVTLSVTAHAAASYKMLFQDSVYGTEKVGSTYFKYTDDGIKLSKKKNSGYKLMAGKHSCYNAVTNGSKVILITYKNYRYYLQSFSTKTQKLTLIKSLPQGNVQNEDYYSFSAVYGKKIFVTRNSEDRWTVATYCYDIATEKYTKVKSNCEIMATNGKYVLGVSELHTDVSPYPTTLYKISGAKLVKVKKISNHAHAFQTVGKKFYYTDYTGDSMRTARLYRMNANGTGKKLLGTFRSSDKYGTVYVTNITSSSCRVYIDGKNYKYTYKTEKLRKI